MRCEPNGIANGLEASNPFAILQTSAQTARQAGEALQALLQDNPSRDFARACLLVCSLDVEPVGPLKRAHQRFQVISAINTLKAQLDHSVQPPPVFDRDWRTIVAAYARQFLVFAADEQSNYSPPQGNLDNAKESVLPAESNQGIWIKYPRTAHDGPLTVVLERGTDNPNEISRRVRMKGDSAAYRFLYSLVRQDSVWAEVKELANHVGVSRQRINKLLHEWGWRLEERTRLPKSWRVWVECPNCKEDSSAQQISSLRYLATRRNGSRSCRCECGLILPLAPVKKKNGRKSKRVFHS